MRRKDIIEKLHELDLQFDALGASSLDPYELGKLHSTVEYILEWSKAQEYGSEDLLERALSARQKVKVLWAAAEKKGLMSQNRLSEIYLSITNIFNEIYEKFYKLNKPLERFVYVKDVAINDFIKFTEFTDDARCVRAEVSNIESLLRDELAPLLMQVVDVQFLPVDSPLFRDTYFRLNYDAKATLTDLMGQYVLPFGLISRVYVATDEYKDDWLVKEDAERDKLFNRGGEGSSADLHDKDGEERLLYFFRVLELSLNSSAREADLAELLHNHKALYKEVLASARQSSAMLAEVKKSISKDIKRSYIAIEKYMRTDKGRIYTREALHYRQYLEREAGSFKKDILGPESYFPEQVFLKYNELVKYLEELEIVVEKTDELYRLEGSKQTVASDCEESTEFLDLLGSNNFNEDSQHCDSSTKITSTNMGATEEPPSQYKRITILLRKGIGTIFLLLSASFMILFLIGLAMDLEEAKKTIIPIIIAMILFAGLGVFGFKLMRVPTAKTQKQ